MRLWLLGMLVLPLLALTACGAGGLLNLSPKPDGNIVVTNSVSGSTLITSAAVPAVVTGGGFSIGITEAHFSGPYTVTVTNWTAPFNIPCFVPHFIATGTQTNIVRFSADNAAPSANPTQPSPCNTFRTTSGIAYDEESVLIGDNDGHVVNFYYSLGPPAGSAATVRPHH